MNTTGTPLCTVKGCERPRHMNLTMCYDHNRAMCRSTSAAYREAQRKRAAASYEERKVKGVYVRKCRDKAPQTPCAMCGKPMDTKRWPHCFDCRAIVRAEAEKRHRADQEAKRKARKAAPPVDPSRGSVWDKEAGKPAGMCITPGCRADSYQNASRCSACVNEQKRTPRERPQNQLKLGPDEANLQRGSRKKQPVLPYSFRAFSWKGTLSEELRNSR